MKASWRYGLNIAAIASGKHWYTTIQCGASAGGFVPSANVPSPSRVQVRLSPLAQTKYWTSHISVVCSQSLGCMSERKCGGAVSRSSSRSKSCTNLLKGPLSADQIGSPSRSSTLSVTV